jgi:hypothetical protein
VGGLGVTLDVKRSLYLVHNEERREMPQQLKVNPEKLDKLISALGGRKRMQQQAREELDRFNALWQQESSTIGTVPGAHLFI